MDANAIAQLIQNVGFPIVMCGALFWKMWKDGENHKEEVDKLTEAINNNTIVLQKILAVFTPESDV